MLLLLLFVGSNAAWGAFTPGTTYYVDLRTVDFYKDGAVLLVNFYNGNEYQGNDNRATVTETSVSHVYSFTIPSITTDNFKIVRLNPNNLDQRWNQTVKMYQNAAGANNCINLTSWPSGDVPCSWTTYVPSEEPDDNCSFTQGETIYFRLNSGINWGDAGGYPAAVFYYSANSAMDTKTNGTNLQVVANQWIGSGNYTTMTSLGNNMWSITIPRNDIGYIQIVRVSGGDANYIWARQNKMSVENAGTNNCIFCESYGDSGAWETYGGGRTNTCGGEEPTTFQGGEVFYMKQNTIDKNGNDCNFLEYGSCDFNLYTVDGNNWLSPGLHAEVIPNTDPVMLKFTVPAEHAGTVWGQVKVKQLEPNGTGHSETKKGAIPKDGKNYLIDGNTMEWGTYVPPTPYTGNLYLIGGSCTGQGWTLGNATLLDNDGNGIYTITRHINAVTDNSSDGFKFLETNANWDSQWRPTEENATVTIDGGKAQSITPDADNIVIKKNPCNTDTKWQLATSGTYTITIDLSDRDNGKMSIEAVPETPHTGDKFYIMGSHNSWCKNCDEHKMTVVDGEYAYKTYENITDNWDFKVAKEDGTELGWSYFSQSKSNYTCTEVPATISNIRPNSYSGAKNLTIYWDGSNVYVHVEDYIAPTATYTVTLHPNNGGSNIERESVPEGSTSSAAELNLAAITYGTGTATWYTNEACTEPFTTVTGDMDLYAKWGVSGNYWLVGDQWMYDTGSSWNNGENPAFTTTDGVATVTFIAPMGRNRFEIIKDNNWGQKINNGNYAAVVNSASPVAISVADGHMEFTLDEMKKVTIIYDGKVSVRAEAYDIHKTGWNIAGNSGLVGQEWNNSACPMDNNGEKILRNINTGNYEFKITPVGSWGIAAVNQFSAANVDKDNSTSNIFRNWTSHLFGSYKDGNEYKLPMNNKKDRNVCIQLTNDMAINGKADIKIAFDGGKITVNLLPKYTVSFDSKGGSDVASQSVFEGTKASEPSAPTKAGCNFQGWQLSGADYSFSSAVTGNITLDAVWAYKAISSVELNESAHTTWLGNSNFVLTPTMTPSDLITKTVEWSSNAEGVASVDNGTVHAVGVGTATITCTVTDQFDNVRSATCKVTVAACEMTTDNLYSMTVTGYNSKTGDNADLSGFWNESSDNDGPAELKAYYLPFSNNSTDGSIFAYDDNGVVKVKSNKTENTSTLWYFIKAGNETFTPSFDNLDGHSVNTPVDVYYVKNKSTNRYLHRGSSEELSGDWKFAQTLTSSSIDNNNINNYKWVIIQPHSGAFYMIPLNMSKKSDGNNIYNAFHLHTCNQYNEGSFDPANYKKPYLICGRQSDNNRCHGIYNFNLNNPDVTEPNPAYIHSQMNSSYFRMKENATVRANLANGLAYGSVITVRLYADAATSVKLQTAAGDDVETINLSADAALEYTYTVAYGSELVGATAFIIKAADNHAGIASIEVSRTHAASPDDPALTWETDLSGGVTQSELAGTFQHVASSARSEGAIHYTSSNEAVATVAADGTVTPIMAGNTTITATIEAEGCYAEASIPYGVTLTEPTLVELIAADAGAGITLTHDYTENIVIDKAVTIDGAGHAIGNLTVQMAGDLTLSGALTVNDFSIYAKAGNTTTPAASGQVRNATNLTANGNAYFYYTIEPGEHVQHGWYDFTVPFRVNTGSGIKGIQDAVLKADFAYGTDYAIIEHLGDKQAAGEYAYKKFQGVMQPCRLYSITLDDDFNYKTLRFQKTNDGALVAADAVTLNAYEGGDAGKANWNGVGNGTLHHANVGVNTEVIQVYNGGVENTFMPIIPSSVSLAIGTAFMVQEAGTMTLGQATNALLAPRRAASVQPTAIQIASEGQPFSDQLFISADETAGQGYTQGADVAKAGNIGNVNVPQIWTNAYNSKLCAHEAQLINGEASYTLSLYAPANGSYTLTSKNIPEGYTLYLTQNGNRIWDLSESYVLDLTKGTATEYGLLLVENYKMPTAVENIGSKADETQKIMRNGILYILRNGKVFNAQGARVK